MAYHAEPARYTRKSAPLRPFIELVLPVRHISPSRPSSTPLPEKRKSQPSVVPPSRPSSTPSNAIGSIMPGTSMHVHSALLSAVAGYVDAAGFASLIGLFPAHLTGEIVGDAIAITSGQTSGHPTRFWMLPVFIGSVTMATVVARTLRRRGRRALTGLLGLVTVALALFAASDSVSRALHESWHIHLLIGGACAVAAMGFQNALMRESLTGSCPTTVMTGNLTHVVIEIVDHVFSRLTRPHKRDRRPRSRLLPVASALGAFIGCAVLGGLLTRELGSLSVALPTALTAAMAFRSWREDRRLAKISALAGSIGPARLPSFDVWPDSLLPSNSQKSEQVFSAPLSSLSVPTHVAVEEPEITREREVVRPPMRRTISGTQLKNTFRKDD